MRKMLLAGIIIPFAVFAECGNYDLPLKTHYDNGYSLGGTNLPNVHLVNPNAVTEYSQGKNPVYYYIDKFIPSTGTYIASKFDRETFTDQKVTDTLNALCTEVNLPIRLSQPTIEVLNQSSLTDVFKQGLNEIGIYHSFVFRNNLFTVILPPNWREDISYPLIINGFYGLNQNLIEQEGPWIIRAIAEKYKSNNKGAVAVLWNGGGAGASFTTSNLAYRDLNDFLKLLLTQIKVKTSQVIAIGGSRGAYTALNIASHPEITAIKVRYVHAINPFDNTDLMARLSGTTIPALLSISDSLSGIYGSWDKRNPILRSGDSEANLTLLKKIEKLKKNKTQIYMSIGTHDFIVPTIVKFNLYKTYQRMGVPVEAEINYLFGHLADREKRQQLLIRALYNIEKPNYRFIIKNKVTKSFINNEGTLTRLDNLPFILELPRYINDFIPSHILAVGQTSTNYKLVFNNNGTLFSYSLRLNKIGNFIAAINQEFPYGESKLIDVLLCKNKCKHLSMLRTVSPIENNLVIYHDNADSKQLTNRPDDHTIELLKNKIDSFPIHYKGNETTVNNGVIGF